MGAAECIDPDAQSVNLAASVAAVASVAQSVAVGRIVWGGGWMPLPHPLGGIP